jgi:hypothetical protein
LSQLSVQNIAFFLSSEDEAVVEEVLDCQVDIQRQLRPSPILIGPL